MKNYKVNSVEKQCEEILKNNGRWSLGCWTESFWHIVKSANNFINVALR